MSKEAVRKERSMVARSERDRVREEKEKEQRDTEEVVETRKSFSDLLGSIRQIDAKTKTRSEEKQQVSQAKTDATDKKQVEAISVERDTKNKGDSINMMWARYMNERDEEVRKLQKQMTTMQGVVQELIGVVRTIQADINRLDKEQCAASETVQTILEILEKM